MLEILVFSVGGSRYGVALGQIVGLVRDVPDTGDPEAGDDSEAWTGLDTVLFEDRDVPVFRADDLLAHTACPSRHPREVLIFSDGCGFYGMAVDSTGSVVQVTPGDDLYTFPPQEVSDVSPCRPWGMLTVAERPVILLDMKALVVH
jgi:hypothetical protein